MIGSVAMRKFLRLIERLAHWAALVLAIARRRYVI